MAEFVKICKSSELFEKKGKKIQFPDDDDLQVALFRIDGKLYCLDNICPHRHAERIFDGIIKDGQVICPLHGWTYKLETGENVNKKVGIKSLNKYKIYEKDGWVWIEKPELKIPKWRQ